MIDVKVGYANSISASCSTGISAAMAVAAIWTTSTACSPMTWAPSTRCASGIHDELRETIRAPVDDRSIKVAVRDLADHDLAPAGPRRAFGQADGPVLGIGEATVRDDRVVQLATPVPEGILGGDAAFIGRALDQHHPPRDVAGGPDVRRRRLQAVVDLDVAPVRRDAGFVESQVVQVPRPADGQHHGLDVEIDRTLAGPIGEAQSAVVTRDGVDPADAGDHLDAVRRERRGKCRGDVLVLARHDARGELQERDRGAEGREDGRELGSGRRRAHDRHGPGKRAQLPHVGMRERELAARERQAPSVATGRDDEPVRLEDLAAGLLDTVRADESDRPATGDQRDAGSREMPDELLLLLQLVDGALGRGEQRRQVHAPLPA